MTDRHAGYVVTLESDVRDDNDKEIITALMMVKGVIAVEPVVASADLQIAQARARGEYGLELLATYRRLADRLGH